mmetsp:Transcript_34332/g.55431  ORF Transcript_34332/g.55431 Transcript_34332/m.55431 type:complete len:127 (+) Transcript_34332:2-382(+)
MRHTLQHTLQDTATQCDTLQHYSSVEVLPIALASAADKPDLAQVMMAKLGGKEFAKKMKLPKQCKEDYDCNEGGYNWPLRCMDFVVAKICVDPDDSTGGGLRASNYDERDLVQEPIPVRVEDGWLH